MRRAIPVVLLLLSLLLAGCAAMFDFNLFKDLGLDPVAAPTPADYAGAGGLDSLAADLSSPAVIDALKADPAATAALESFLQGLISGGVDSPEEQQAAILLADLDLKTTNGEEFVNNIVVVLMTPYDPGVKIADLLASIMPGRGGEQPDGILGHDPGADRRERRVLRSRAEHRLGGQHNRAAAGRRPRRRRQEPSAGSECR